MERYKTYSLNKVAYLRMHGLHPIDIRKVLGRPAFAWEYHDTDELRDLVEKLDGGLTSENATILRFLACRYEALREARSSDE